MNNLGEFLANTFEKVKGIADVNSIVGNPITTPDGTTLIPVTKVSVGVAGAGSDGATAKDSEKLKFSAGTGAGVTMTPVAFIVISNGNTRVVYVNQGSSVGAIDRLIDMVPDTIDKISGIISDKKGKNEENIEEDEIIED